MLVQRYERRPSIDQALSQSLVLEGYLRQWRMTQTPSLGPSFSFWVETLCTF